MGTCTREIGFSSWLVNGPSHRSLAKCSSVLKLPGHGPELVSPGKEAVSGQPHPRKDIQREYLTQENRKDEKEKTAHSTSHQVACH